MQIPDDTTAARAEYMRRYYAENAEYREATKARVKAHRAKRFAEDPDAVRAAEAARAARYRARNPGVGSKHGRAARARAKEFVNAIKVATPCADCGKYFPAVCMDFDHLDAGEKESCVGTLVNKAHSLKRIAREVAKCDVVCSNCHRLRTMARWDADDVGEVL